MDLVFIYYNNLEFQDNKIFSINFNDGDRLLGWEILFRKSRDYYLTSMFCFTEITNYLSELEHYDNITKISHFSNKIFKNGVEHLYEEKEIEGFFGDLKCKFTPEKSNRTLSAEIVEFFDYVTKQKKYVFVYSPYQELKNFGLKFENKKKAMSIVTLFC